MHMCMYMHMHMYIYIYILFVVWLHYISYQLHIDMNVMSEPDEFKNRLSQPIGFGTNVSDLKFLEILVMVLNIALY